MEIHQVQKCAVQIEDSGFGQLKIFGRSELVSQSRQGVATVTVSSMIFVWPPS
jgi:hypothetical protein